MRTIIVLSLLGMALSGCTSEETSSASNDVVELLALAFEPGDITVEVGDSVTFNVIERSHTIDFAEGSGDVAGVSKAHSGNLVEGTSYTVTFTEPGTYAYFCAYHSSLSGGERVGMIGTITVI